MEIFTALAALMGSPSMTYAGPEQVMNEIAGLIDVYRGISYDRLTEKGIPWPCVDAEDPGKSILYESGFPGGKAHFVPAARPDALSREGLPMRLVPGILKFHSGSFSEWSPSLMEVCPEGFVEMNSNDMKELGLLEEETVKITSSGGPPYWFV